MNLNPTEVDLLRDASKDEKAFQQLSELVTGYQLKTRNSTILLNLLGTMRDQIAVIDRTGRTLYTNVTEINCSNLPTKTEIISAWQELDALLENNTGRSTPDNDRSPSCPKQGFTKFRQIISQDERRYIEDIWQPVYHADGELGCLMVTCRDITNHIQFQETVAQKAQEFATLIDHIPDPIARFDQHNKLIYANKALIRLLDRSPSALIGKSITELGLNAENAAIWKNGLHRATTERAELDFEFEISAPSQTRHYQIHFTPEYTTLQNTDVANTNNHDFSVTQATTVLAVIHDVTDITKRKQTEESLTTFLVQYRVLENSIHDVISMHDLNGNFAYVSPSVERVLGWTPQELLGRKGIGKLYPENYLPVVNKYLTDLIAEGDKQVISQCWRKDGVIIWLEIFGHVIADENGKPSRLVTSSRDITQRVKAEDMLRESEERYRLLANNSPDTAFYQDRDLRYHWVVNPTPSFNEPIILGKTDLELLPDPVGQNLTDLKMKVINEGIAATTELQLVQQYDGGALHIYEAIYVPRRNRNQQIIGLAGYVRDITERKRAEQALIEQESLRAAFQKEAELNQLKSRMMLRISHEFRTPLAIIQAFIELLSKNYADFQDNLEKYSKIILDEIFTVVKMLDNISLVVHGEQHRLSVHASTFDLEQLCRDVVGGFIAVMPEERQIEIKRASELPNITADKEMIRSVISNLLSNAIKYSHAPTPIIFDLTSNNSNDGADHITIAVTDQGIGIPLDDLQRICEPFYRGQNVEQIGGIGIGMSILKDAVDLHQGRIEIESTPGIGTCIKVHLPITRL